MHLDTEKELEDFLMKNDNLSLYLEDYSNNRKRQVKIGNYGIIDILSIACVDPPFSGDNYGKGSINITIYELKKDEIDINSLFQVSVYRKGIKEILETMDLTQIKEQFKIYIKCVLIGKAVNKKADLIFLLEQIEWLDIYFYSLDFDEGMEFILDDSSWVRAKNKFRNKEIDNIKAELNQIYMEFQS